MKRARLFSTFTLLLLILPMASGCDRGPKVDKAVLGATRADVEARFKQETASFEQAFDAKQKTGSLDNPAVYDMTPTADYFSAVMKDAKDPAARRAAAVHLVSLRNYRVLLPSATHDAVAKVVPPASPDWGLTQQAVELEAQGLEPGASKAFLTAVRKTNPDRTLQAKALIQLTREARRQVQAAEYAAYFEDLKTYKDLKDLVYFMKLISPKNKVLIGQPAPVLQLPDVETGKPFSTASLQGKPYLIDFWATWCGPCLGERANLNKLRQTYPPETFEIVSVSLDKTPEKVAEFRQRHAAMPWINLLLKGSTKSPEAKAFDMDWSGLPRLVLVDRHGRVVATQNDLGPGLLEKRVAEVVAAT